MSQNFWQYSVYINKDFTEILINSIKITFSVLSYQTKNIGIKSDLIHPIKGSRVSNICIKNDYFKK